jgi:hypothetical protein
MTKIFVQLNIDFAPTYGGGIFRTAENAVVSMQKEGIFK